MGKEAKSITAQERTELLAKAELQVKQVQHKIFGGLPRSYRKRIHQHSVPNYNRGTEDLPSIQKTLLRGGEHITNIYSRPLK